MTRSTDPRDDDDPSGRHDEAGYLARSDVAGGSGGLLTGLEGLRRRLDPEHPDPDRLRRRIQLALQPPASTPSQAALDLDASGPAAGARTLTNDRPRRRTLSSAPVLVAAVTVLVVLLVYGVVVMRGPLGDRWFGVAGTPTLPVSTSQPTTSGPTTSPPSTVPAGFRDCSLSLGAGAYCAEPAECWAGVISLADQPLVGTRSSCSQSHVFQTFAAVLVVTPYNRQSQFEKLAIVKQLCSTRTLSTVLAGNGLPKRFEILVLPPDKKDTTQVVRCIAGDGNRRSPLPFQRAR